MEYQQLLKRVLHKMERFEVETGISEECPISIIDMEAWEWAQGVGLYGMLKYYQATGEQATLNRLTAWFEANFKKGLPEKNINTMCPLLTLAFVYEYTNDARYLAVCTEWAAWLTETMHRTPENGFPHLVSGYGETNDLWDDTLYMAVLFLAKMGRLLNRQDYIDESVRQFLLHIKYLIDPKTGLFFHGWTFDGRHHFGEALWGRGNCWYTAGLVDYLDIVGKCGGGTKLFLLDTLRAQVDALAPLQAQSGMWHTLLNEPDSYEETSATAGFAYGILKAVRMGYLPAAYREMGERALTAVARSVAEDGTVQGVSYGTGVSNQLESYRTVPLCPMMYGQALAALAFVEGMQLEGESAC